MLKGTPPFHHLDNTQFYNLRCIELINAPSVKLHGPFCHLATLRLDQIRDGLEGRALAGAIGAEQRGDLSLIYVEGDTFEDKYYVLVNDLNIVDFQ